MRKIVAVLLIASVATLSCAHNQIVKVEAEDGKTYNVRAEKEQPMALDTPIVWADYLLWTGIGLGISTIVTVVAIGAASQAAQARAAALR